MNEISIRTERLLLRRWKPEDLPALVALNQDPAVMQFIGPVLTEEESRAMVARAEKNWSDLGYGRFAVEVLGKGETVGFIGLAQCKFESHFTPAIEIGWRLSKEFWNLGYATEGAGAVMSWAFEDRGMMEIVSFTSTTNQQSRRVMEKIGMRRDEKEDFLHPNKETTDPLRTNVLYRKRTSQ